MNTIAQLDLVPALRPGENLGGGAYKTERSFLDFVIDGVSLFDEMKKRGHDCISVLWDEKPARNAVQMAIRRLALEEPADFPNNRRAIYICPECGDLGCGALSAVIEDTGNKIVWRDFGFENNYEEDVDLDSFKSIGPYAFDKKRYLERLREASKQLLG